MNFMATPLFITVFPVCEWRLYHMRNLRLQGTVHTQKAQVTLFSPWNWLTFSIFNADTDYYFVICNLPCYSLVYMHSDDTCFVQLQYYLGAAFVSHICNVTYVSPCIRHCSLARRDIPSMNSHIMQLRPKIGRHRSIFIEWEFIWYNFVVKVCSEV